MEKTHPVLENLLDKVDDMTEEQLIELDKELDSILEEFAEFDDEF